MLLFYFYSQSIFQIKSHCYITLS